MGFKTQVPLEALLTTSIAIFREKPIHEKVIVRSSKPLVEKGYYLLTTIL